MSRDSSLKLENRYQKSCQKTVTEQALTELGISHQTANKIDTIISVAGTGGAEAGRRWLVYGAREAALTRQVQLSSGVIEVTGRGLGFKSFDAFKRAMGPAGPGNAWHHIVEQRPSNILKFGEEAIHNTNNLIILPTGKGSIHTRISGFYSSKQRYLTGSDTLTVRQWLDTKSFEFQYNFGIEKLKELGWTP